MSRKKIYILNGPNLAALGSRQPEIYGTETLDDIKRELIGIFKDAMPKNSVLPNDAALDTVQSESAAANNPVELVFRQTNSEAEIIDCIHRARDDGFAVIINPAAFTHYSYALGDALIILKEAEIPVIEVHLSNPYSREEFRRNNVISPFVTGQVSGLGVNSYKLALDYVMKMIL